MPNERLIGVVRWYNPNKGYGFIVTPASPGDVFVHVTAVEDAKLDPLNSGDVLEFSLESNKGKTFAYYLTRLATGLLPGNLEQDKSLLRSVKISFNEINEKLIGHLQKDPNEIYRLSPRGYEELIEELLRDMGYETMLTPQTSDGGVDIYAALKIPPNQEMLIAIECKQYAPHRKVGIEIVERFMWIVERKEIANKGMVITTSSFSRKALKLERDYKSRLSLHDSKDVNDWLSKYGTWNRSDKAGIWLPGNARA